jgi:hypothetical protein
MIVVPITPSKHRKKPVIRAFISAIKISRAKMMRARIYTPSSVLTNANPDKTSPESSF